MPILSKATILQAMQLRKGLNSPIELYKVKRTYTSKNAKRSVNTNEKKQCIL